MNFRQILGLVFVAVGIVLVVLAVQATDTFAERVVQEMSGRYTDETKWDLIGGIALVILGGCMVIFCRNRRA